MLANKQSEMVSQLVKATDSRAYCHAHSDYKSDRRANYFTVAWILVTKFCQILI